jgi:hypothetical protein
MLLLFIYIFMLQFFIINNGAECQEKYAAPQSSAAGTNGATGTKDAARAGSIP